MRLNKTAEYLRLLGCGIGRRPRLDLAVVIFWMDVDWRRLSLTEKKGRPEASPQQLKVSMIQWLDTRGLV